LLVEGHKEEQRKGYELFVIDGQRETPHRDPSLRNKVVRVQQLLLLFLLGLEPLGQLNFGQSLASLRVRPNN